MRYCLEITKLHRQTDQPKFMHVNIKRGSNLGATLIQQSHFFRDILTHINYCIWQFLSFTGVGLSALFRLKRIMLTFLVVDTETGNLKNQEWGSLFLSFHLLNS